jgi:hypothetical protein
MEAGRIVQSDQCDARADAKVGYARRPEMPAVLKKLIGETVLYTPPQDCRGKTTLDFYPAVITQINPDGTAELTTMGPNSIYFQHNVEYSEHQRPNTWRNRFN